jgi:hypothetical protein
MPSSNPPPLDEPLNTYFAVQLKPAEQAIHVVEAVLKAAKASSLLFRRLEQLDILTIGTLTLVRMRADLVNPYPVLDRLYAEGRAVVSSMQGGEYVARLPGGRMGKVSNVTMHAIAKLGQPKMFRGTKMKYWERQFEAA